MSIASEIARIQGNVTSALTAIENKGVTVPTGSNSDDLATLIGQIETGGGGGGSVKTRKDVNFFDYDGTIVESYTAQEAAALTALPANPSHTGLTAQGWNYTLEQMKAEVTAQGKCDIGQMYITDDGKTRVYVTLPEERLHPYLGLGVNGTVVVDWGDGSETSTLTGTSLTTAKNTDHIYAAPGDYVITLEATSGTYSIFGGSNSTHLLKRNSSNPSSAYRAYPNAIKAVEIGANTSIGNYAFSCCGSLAAVTIPSGAATGINTYAFAFCYSLTAVTIPSGITSIGTYAFSSCHSLKAVTIPSGVTSIGSNAFVSCDSLTAVTIPNGVTSIGATTFYNCHLLTAITITSDVTSVATSAFSNCYSLMVIHFEPQTPPTVASTNAFSNLPTDCTIYVPTGTLEAYTTATNYPNPSTYTYVEE